MRSTPGWSSVAAVLLLCLPSPSRAQQAAPARGLEAFRSDAEVTAYVRAIRDRLEAEQREQARRRAAERRRVTTAPAVACRDSTARRVRAAARAAGAAPRNAVITGCVRADDGRPIGGANVYVTELGATAVTNDSGGFALVLPGARLAPDSSLTVRARAIGYRPAATSTAISEGDSVRLQFTLADDVNHLDAITVSGVALEEANLQAGVVSITNTQHAGVDEGGIVKLHGEHLVVLRRGRLFTIRLGDESLEPVSAVDAFGPDIGPHGAWYDEMLVADDHVVVIGYSYGREGTELVLFGLDRAGRLTYRDTYHLRSNDYYSSRNYASRLIGTRLVFYTPLYLALHSGDPTAALPALRRWTGDARARWERIVTPQRIYRPGRDLAPQQTALHTVTSCDLATMPRLQCESTVVIGPPGRVFYTSPTSVYVWLTTWRWPRGRDASLLVRMPLDGSRPSAIGVAGAPTDQFSFLESADGHINVLVRAEARGEAMWGAERGHGEAALLRIPLAAFGDGREKAARESYRDLPAPDGYPFHNRFVGDHVLYGRGTGWGRPTNRAATLYVVPWRGGDVSRLELEHGVDRIEVMGGGAVVVGADERDLLFSGIRLDGRPSVRQRYVLADASQGETRSHGFFYRNDGAEDGVIGLPVARAGRPGWRQLRESSSAVLYLRNNGRDFLRLGELAANDGAHKLDDGCRASCVDWYGNSRPIFIGTRVFALLGYELVEGDLAGSRIRELRRVSFAPRGAMARMKTATAW